MPQDMEFVIRMTVNSEEESTKILEAVYSGLASELVRIGVLYGQVPVGGAVPITTAPPLNHEKQEAKEREASIELKRIDDEVTTRTSAQVEKPVERKDRPTGLAGRRRLGRK